MYIWLCLAAALVLNNYVMCFDDVPEKLHRYFKSDIVKTISADKVNVQMRQKYESLIRDMLVTGVDYRMIPRDDNKKLISRGFLVNDGSVHLLMHNMTLRGVRHSSFLNNVALSVAYNHLALRGAVVKMFLDTDYFLFRPQSQVQLWAGEKSADQYSPFNLDQVQPKGNFTIIAQNCKITGKVFTKLDDPSIALGHSDFRLDDCKFDVEVSTPGQGIAPVMAPYFHGEKSAELARLFGVVFGDILTLRMQLIIYFFVLIEDIIKIGDVKQFSSEQESLLKYSADFMNAVVNQADATIANKMSTYGLPDLHIFVKDQANGKPTVFEVSLTNIVVNGLDSMYSANSGGPQLYLQNVMITEAIMFHSLTVKGLIELEKQEVRGNYEYFVEMKDVRVDVSIDFGGNPKSAVTVETARFVGWKTLDHSILILEPGNKRREMLNALIIAHLSQELPNILEHHVKKTLQDSITAMFRKQKSPKPIKTTAKTQPMNTMNTKIPTKKYRSEIVTEYTDLKTDKCDEKNNVDFVDESETAVEQAAPVTIDQTDVDENVVNESTE
ncbi:unnamed protein product [Plutella xylostella]|uniref:(diamondback moth) hypothetical protein n=1 Tax=Plutella xylostella TaxID=51655 RepID=A0A8S4DQ39_PLUXY|nr:unnamed protein product [Plutella xylostella]